MQGLRSITDHLEDVDCKTIGCIVELLVQALSHVLLIDGLMNEGFDDRLWIPVRKTMHNSCELFIGIDRAIASFLVLQGSVGVNCCFCSRVSG